MLRRVRRVPLPLAAILAMATIQAATWALVIPALQAPDEVDHFAYVQRIVEAGEVPWRPLGDAVAERGRYRYSDELEVALTQAGLRQLAGNTAARPLWTAADERVWRSRAAPLTDAQRANGGLTSTLRNPPLYYVLQAAPYAAAGGTFFDRQFAMRLANIPLLLVALVFVWLLAGELVGRGWPQVLATASAALLPQLTNVAAGVGPDILLVAVWAAALYAMVLLVRRGPSRGRLAALALLCAAAALTHGRGLPVLLPAAMAVTLAAAHARGRRLPPAVLGLAVGAAGLAGTIAVAAAGRGSVREFGSYLWQFYLPRLDFMTPALGPPGYGAREAFVDRLYGTLAQLEVVLPRAVADWLFALTLIGLAALAVVLVLRRAALRREAATAWVLVSAAIALLVTLHLVAYRAMLTTPGDPIVTARYLLPLLPLFGTAVALVVSSLPARAAGALAGLVLAAGVALQAESLGLLLERFYA